MNANSQCSSCINWGEVGGGDWVPYGSTNVRLPIEYGCRYEGDPGLETKEEILNAYEELENLALQFKCPKYRELPKCPKHPSQYIYPLSGCNECEYEAWVSINDDAFERR